MFWTDLVFYVASCLVNISIQVQIPRDRAGRTFVTQMKCSITSNTTGDVLISNEITYRSYKEICGGEKKKVNLGFIYEWFFKVENNKLVHIPRENYHHIYGIFTLMPYAWELLSKFFSNHNIEPNWLDCNFTAGWYDDEQGGWTGCMGKV